MKAWGSAARSTTPSRLWADGTLSFATAEGVSLEDAHLLDVVDWLNFWLGWPGDEGDRHQPPDLSAA